MNFLNKEILRFFFQRKMKNSYTRNLILNHNVPKIVFKIKNNLKVHDCLKIFALKDCFTIK